MSKKTRGIVAMLMTGVMVLSPTMTALSGVFSFASDTEEEMLFQTSFEKGEEEIVGKSQGESGVIQTAYGIKGKGFEVRLDSVQVLCGICPEKRSVSFSLLVKGNLTQIHDCFRVVGRQTLLIKA